MTRRQWRTIAAIGAWIASAPVLRAQDKLTLEQFISAAVRNSAAVQIAGESVSGAEYRVREAMSSNLPQVSFASSYTRLSLTSEFDIPNLGHFKFSSPDNYSFRLGGTQALFTWGRIKKTIAMSKIGTDIARSGVVLTTQVLAYQIVPIFYGILFTGEAVKVIDTTLASLDGKLAILEERFRAGLVSDLDISLLKVQTSGLKSQRLDFLNSLNDMMMTYNRIAGRPLESTFVPVASLAFEPFRAEPTVLLAEAVANRPEALLIQNQKELAQTQIALTRTADKPNVFASFNYEFRNGYLPNVNTIRGYWNAVLAVSYPVFDGNRTRAQVAESQVALRTVEEQASDMEKGFGLEIAQALADIRSFEDKIAIEATKIEYSEKALKIADERYRNGLLNMTELVDTQNSLDTARLNYLQLVYNHILGRFTLLRAAGRKLVN
ncbi:MAG: TolC family protein [Candidatus Aminicenantales bacterium]